jgi:hypothetical protein
MTKTMRETMLWCMEVLERDAALVSVNRAVFSSNCINYFP